MIGFFRAFFVIPVLLLFFLMASSVASAQQNLVVNPGFESGNTGFYTDYVHNTGQWVEAGHYEIDNTTSGYAGGVGWPMPSDSHGQFMIVNGFGGNNNQTKVVWQQTIPVSTQTTYTISYRVVNLNRVILGQSVRAKLRVKINDNYVGQQNDLPSNNNWQSWSASWQSGNNAQAVIKIYDVCGGDSEWGDDFCLDDISFVPDVIYSVDAQDDYVDAPLCLNDTIDVDVLSNDNVLPNTNDAQVQILTNPIPHGTAEVLPNKKIRYIFNDANYFGEVQLDYRVTLHGLQSDASVHLTVNSVPIVGSISAPPGICEGDAFDFTNSTPQVTWQHNDPNTCSGSWEIQIDGEWVSLVNSNIPYAYNGCLVRYKAVNVCGIAYSTNNVQVTVYSTAPIDEGMITACDAIYHHGLLCGATGMYTFDSITPNGCHIQVSWHFTLGDVNIMAPEVHEECYSYYWPRTGQTYYESMVVHDTVYSSDPQVCDSIFTLDLTINNAPAIQGNIQAQDICAGELLEITEPEYAYNHSGGGSHQWEYASSLDGPFQAFDPETYHFGYGSYYIRFAVANSCDSVFSNTIEVHVNDRPVINGQLEPIEICENNPLALPEVTVDWHNAGQTGFAEWQMSANQGGPYASFDPNSQIQLGQDGYWVRYLASNECDTVFLGPVSITVIPIQEEWIDHIDCDTVWFEGIAYTEEQVVPEEFNDPCPHIIHHHIVVNHSDRPETNPTLIEEITSCNDEFEWHGNTYYRSDGPQTDRWITENVLGCDSIRELRLAFGDYATKTDYIMECDAFTWARNNMTYYYDESHPQILDSVSIPGNEAACDSVIYLNLLLGRSYEREGEPLVGCRGYEWHGVTYYENAIVYDSLKTKITHCDSIVSHQLTILQSFLNEFDTIACDPFEWYGYECVYTPNGMTIQHVFESASGCDSTVIKHVYVNSSVVSTGFRTVCAPYACPYDGVLYDVPGVYVIDTGAIVNQYGCDSILYRIRIEVKDSDQIGLISGPSHVYVASSLVNGIYRYEINLDEVEGGITWSLSNADWQIVEAQQNYCLVFVTTPGTATLSASFLAAECGEMVRSFEINAGFFGVDDHAVVVANVYPNPTKGSVTVEAEGIESIRLTDMMGQVLDWCEYDRSNTVVLHLNGFAPSVYLLEIKTVNGIAKKRVVVSR